MRTIRPHQLPPNRLWAAWLAVLLVLFAAFAPTVSHAIALERGAPGIEICTSSGTQIIPTDSPTGPESVVSLSHCPFCLHSADRVAPPPSPVAYLFLVTGGQQEATVWQAFFYSQKPYFNADPRGPPEFARAI